MHSNTKSEIPLLQFFALILILNRMQLNQDQFTGPKDEPGRIKMQIF